MASGSNYYCRLSSAMVNKVSSIFMAAAMISCLMSSISAFTLTRSRIRTLLYSSTSFKTQLYSSTSRKTYSSRKEEAKLLGKSAKELNWEHYDFSLNPKLDNRFGNAEDLTSGRKLDIEEEAKEDRKHAKEMNEKNDAYKKLDPELVQKAIEVLEPFINEERLQRVSSVLRKRTKRAKFLFENVSCRKSSMITAPLAMVISYYVWLSLRQNFLWLH